MIYDFQGLDNDGIPKTDYLEKLSKMDEKELKEECESTIWLSAYANNNPRSDFHWKCYACYCECSNRNMLHIYEIAHKNISSSV